MTILGWVLLGALVLSLLFALCYQADLMAARWLRRNRERAERWEANQRGSARVIDFEQYLLRKRAQDAVPCEQEFYP